jgi:DNA-binding transcriptional LysR family regulator
MTLDLRQLRHILALAEHGSFARAAMALPLSQPALSRSIQGVEQQIGKQLFVRTATGVEPTDVGRVFILRARQILQMSDELDEEITSDRALQSGHVWVGGGPHPAQSTLALALARFVPAYPRVSVRLVIRDWDELLRALRSRDIEFFVAETSTLEREVDVEVEPMPAHPVYFAARAGHPLAGRRSLIATDAFAYPLVSLSRIPPRMLEPLRAMQRKSGDSEAARRSFPALECNVLSVIMQVVLGSDAVMATMLTSIADELESGRLTLLGSQPLLSTHYGIVRLKNHPLSSASARFRDFILESEHETSRAEEELLARLMPTAGRSRASSPRKRSRPDRVGKSGKPGTKRPATGL